MNINKKSYLPAIFGFIVLGSIFFILLLNKFFSDPSLYGSYLFLVQTNKYNIIIYLLLSLGVYSVFYMLFERKYISVNEKSSCSLFYYIVAVSFIFKILLLKFNVITEDVTGDLDKIFLNGEFNQYKLYSYIAYFISLLTKNYNIVLTYFNILLGSLLVGYVYKLVYKVNPSQLIALMVSLLVLFFMPINMIQLLLRVDTLFLLLFIYTLYTLFTQIDNNKYKHIVTLNILVFLMSLCRESTLYMLPLFILIGYFIKDRRFLTLASISLIILITTSAMSFYNLDEYGMKSRVKNYHLMYNMLHYGYFNDSISSEIVKELSPNALILYKDISQSYKNSVPPHKRSDFTTKLTWLKPWLRSDIENVVLKSKVTPYSGDFALSKSKLFESLNRINESISYEDLNIALMTSHLDMQDGEQKDLTEFLSNQLMHTFLLDTYQLNGEPRIKCLDAHLIKIDKKLMFKVNCVKNKLRNIGESYMSAQSDNWTYKRALLPYVWNFNSSTKKYKQHPDIDLVSEIALSRPGLYVSQSILTLTGMSGFMPEISGIGFSNKIYENVIISKYISVTFQKFYAVILNFWYLFAILNLLGALMFINDSGIKRNTILMSIIPLYYGIFIVFAAQFEFSRLMLPVVPFIIFNYVSVIAYISSVFIKYDKK